MGRARFHHRLLHEGKCNVKRIGSNHFEFKDPQGRVIQDPPPMPMGSLAGLLRPQRHYDIDEDTGISQWDGKPPDYCSIIAFLMEDYERAHARECCG